MHPRPGRAATVAGETVAVQTVVAVVHAAKSEGRFVEFQIIDGGNRGAYITEVDAKLAHEQLAIVRFIRVRNIRLPRFDSRFGGCAENLIQRAPDLAASVLVEAVRIEGSAFIDFFFRCLANGRIEGTRWGKQDRGALSSSLRMRS